MNMHTLVLALCVVLASSPAVVLAEDVVVDLTLLSEDCLKSYADFNAEIDEAGCNIPYDIVRWWSLDEDSLVWFQPKYCEEADEGSCRTVLKTATAALEAGCSAELDFRSGEETAVWWLVDQYYQDFHGWESWLCMDVECFLESEEYRGIRDVGLAIRNKKGQCGAKTEDEYGDADKCPIADLEAYCEYDGCGDKMWNKRQQVCVWVCVMFHSCMYDDDVMD
jgi:hypothetical protein